MLNHPEKVDGKYDEYGLPNVMGIFDKDKRDDLLTIEEALIKLNNFEEEEVE